MVTSAMCILLNLKTGGVCSSNFSPFHHLSSKLFRFLVRQPAITSLFIERKQPSQILSIQESEGKTTFISYLTLEDIKSNFGRNANKSYLMNTSWTNWMEVLLECLTDGWKLLGYKLALMEHS